MSLLTNSQSTFLARKPHQKGVALITVLMVVALSTSIAAYLIWVVNQRIELHEMHYQRLQSRLVVQTGSEWASAILLIDQQKTGRVDHLNEVWAQTLPTLPVRVRPEDPSSSIEISGSMEDEQGKFNINNLVFAKSNERKSVVAALNKLLITLNLDLTLALYLRDWLDADDEPIDANSAESDYYLRLIPPYRAANQPQAELANLTRIREFTPQVLSTLAPYITFLPKYTKVNINTSSAEVMSAVIPELSYSEALSIVESRKTEPFKTLKDFLLLFTKESQARMPINLLSVNSSFFSVKSQAVQEDNFIESSSLLERKARGWPIIWWQKIH